MTQTDYDNMLTAQNGVCAICGNPPKSGKKLVVDHNHKTGEVRGLLCTPCNTGIGLLKDNQAILKNASNYI
jgi:formate dehydrogenase maturation protein FdhE